MTEGNGKRLERSHGTFSPRVREWLERRSRSFAEATSSKKGRPKDKVTYGARPKGEKG